MVSKVTDKVSFSDLKLLDGNRDINERHVDKLAESIRTNGYVASLPIIIDKEGYILDGQHRYFACKKAKVKPTIAVEENVDLIPLINSMQLKWDLKSYVKYYAAKGFADYIILQSICKDKDLSPGIVLNIIYGRTIHSSMTRSLRADQQAFVKMGDFKFPEHTEKYFKKLDRKIEAILGLIRELNLPRTDRLIVAITRLAQDSNFSFSTMHSKIQYQRARIYRCTTIQEYMNMLSSIYNNKNSKKVLA